MSIFEYDEVKEKELIRQAEFEMGKREHLKDQIRIKLQKGKNPQQIAEELEEDISSVEQLIREIEKNQK